MRDSTKELIERYEERIALMKLEDGVVQFEYKSGYDSEWTTFTDPISPAWSCSIYWEYRVKPKPIEVWTWKCPNNGSIGQDFHNKNCQNFYNKKQPDDTSGRVMILLREVTE